MAGIMAGIGLYREYAIAIQDEVGDSMEVLDMER